LVEILPTGEAIEDKQPLEFRKTTTAVVQAQERYQQYQRSRLEMMRGYAELRDCRREYLLNYFGEAIDEPCGFCDNCKAGITVEQDESHEPFELNSRIVHRSWGPGQVMRYEGEKVVILFDR